MALSHNVNSKNNKGLTRRSFLKRSLLGSSLIFFSGTSYKALLGQKVLGTSAASTPLSLEQVTLSDQDIERLLWKRLVVGFQGESPEDRNFQAFISFLKNRPHLGGVIFMGGNIKSPDSVRAMTKKIREISPHIYLMVDQEGGLVQRLRASTGFKDFPSQETLSGFSEDQVRQSYYDMALTLKDVGFNWNLAPVLDLGVYDDNAMRKHHRAFLGDANQVATLGRIAVQSLQEAGVVATMKHFPGHGASPVDSHEAFPYLKERWTQDDLKPFVQVSALRPVSLMVGHLILPISSRETEVPVTLSQDWGRFIREGDHMAFPGIVMTDDMSMLPIRENYAMDLSFKRTLQCEYDLVMYTGFGYEEGKLGKHLELFDRFIPAYAQEMKDAVRQAKETRGIQDNNMIYQEIAHLKRMAQRFKEIDDFLFSR